MWHELGILLLSKCFACMGCICGMFWRADVYFTANIYMCFPASVLVVLVPISVLYRFHASSYCCLHNPYTLQQSSVLVSRMCVSCPVQSSSSSTTKCCNGWRLFWHNYIEQWGSCRLMRLDIVSVGDWLEIRVCIPLVLWYMMTLSWEYGALVSISLPPCFLVSVYCGELLSPK